MPDAPPLPGGVGVTHLRVYTSAAPDGLAGGTPHLHTACTEAYWVVAGTGRVQTITSEGFAETTLSPGALVWFTPGTIHRLVNDSGDLEILVIMANSGLPEAGDMVIVQPPDVLADAETYRRAVDLPAGAMTTDGDPGPARVRRNTAVDAFNAIRDELGGGRRQLLDDFLDHATATVAGRTATWRRRWTETALVAATRTGEHLDALAEDDGTHLRRASVHRRDRQDDPRRLGCCGTLGTYVSADGEKR